ncbi:MAG: hypothetical protein RR280_01340 [Bacteroidaceae bacterium]
MEKQLQMMLNTSTVRVYKPEYKQKLGSLPAAVLLSQMLYWWEVSGYGTFYKFKSPCKHKLYRNGDSWCEELGLTIREFDTALAKLVSKDLLNIRRDFSNATWYSFKKDQLLAFLCACYSTEPVDKLGHVAAQLNLKKLEDLIKSGASDAEIAAFTKQHIRISVEGNSAIGNAHLSFPRDAHLSFPSYIQIIQKNILLNGINSVVKKFVKIESPLNPAEEQNVNFDDLVRKTGNADIAEKLMKNMPKPKAGAKPSFGQVVIAWKSSYGEISQSFCGGITQKDEAQLKHIFKDYPSDAAAIVKHCVFDWATFRNTVIRDKGLSNAPAVPTISFLSTYREIAHKVYTGGETATVAPAQTNQVSEIEQLGLTSAEDFLRTL